MTEPSAACPKCGMPGAAYSTHVCMTAGEVPDPPDIAGVLEAVAADRLPDPEEVWVSDETMRLSADLRAAGEEGTP